MRYEEKSLKIKEVKPYPKNAKKHPAEQIANIAESIRQFGWTQPIVVDEDGVIIIGHGVCHIIAETSVYIPQEIADCIVKRIKCFEKFAECGLIRRI